ncbi:M48 family peptidase [Adhaeribacter arboris]|uniref:M48 family peptidase n=1 Tax=Adhaeribacter arboris TaxID=2072846 RepID=A0A2T2YGM7_9BACT|nr:SprT family zinc-dependent metalloprotease [Adhaeribacter arboris]PSR54671.1 M48 family peptidase [Adhaeribacter arboris]
MPSSKPPISSVRVHVEEIGTVLFERSAKAKRISIRIKPLEGVRVAMPPCVSFEKAQEFLLSKKEWIKHHLQNIKTQENKRTIYNQQSSFRTFNHTLHLQAVPASFRLKARITDNTLLVTYPAHKSEEEEEVQQFIRQAIEATYRLEAKAYLPGRVAFFARKFGFTYNKVVIKNTSTRWGSCSAVNNINLNLHLMRLPEPLRDYVILHELAHTVEKNHGPRFWALLDRISGNARYLDKQMKNYRVAIF